MTNNPYLSADDPREEEVAEERTNSYLVRLSWYLSQTESSVSLHPLEYYSVGLTQQPLIVMVVVCWDIKKLLVALIKVSTLT